MEAGNTVERGPASEGSLRAEHRSGNRRLCELDRKFLAVLLELPRPSFCSDEWRHKQKYPRPRCLRN